MTAVMKVVGEPEKKALRASQSQPSTEESRTSTQSGMQNSWCAYGRWPTGRRISGSCGPMSAAAQSSKSIWTLTSEKRQEL